MPLKDGLNRNFSWYGKYKLLNKKHISISSIKKMSQCSSVDRECSICKAKNFSNNYKIENFLFLMLQRSNLDKPFPVLFISPHRIFWSVPSSPRRTHISWSPDKIISLKIKYTCLLLKNGASLSNEVSFQNHIPFYWPINRQNTFKWNSYIITNNLHNRSTQITVWNSNSTNYNWNITS